MTRIHRWYMYVACAGAAALVVGCGGAATSDTTSVGETTTTTSTTITTTTMPTTTTTVALFDTLNDHQKEVVDYVCTGDVDRYLEVMTGGSGVPALEDLFNELGADASKEERAEAAQPICQEIGWVQLVG